MPRASLRFKLPEEREEFEDAQNGGKYAGHLHDISQFLRSKIKYAPDSVSEDTIKAYEEILQKLAEIRYDD